MLFTHDQIARINATSLRILESTGVKIALPGILGLLRQAGCQVGADADVVRIPRGLVTDCLASAPGRFTLADITGGETTLTPGGTPLFWTCNALSIFDEDGARPIEEADFVNWTRVTDALEHVHAAVAPTIADYPPFTRDFVGFRLLAENTTKHFRPCIYTPDGALAILEMAQVLLGGTPLRERPIVSFGYTIISPLQWSASALELFQKTSGHGVPMMINAEPTAGSTSPVTLAGTLALANAEALSGVVITQLLEPGRPVVFNLGFSHTMDMRQAVTRTGGPENGLLGLAGAQLAASHGLPSASWASTESMCEDQQSAAEFASVALMHALGGVNIIWGVGQLESQRTISLAKGVIDNEIAGWALRAARGVEVSDEALAEAVIAQVGHRADYLAHEHTLSHFRDELFMPDLALCGRREAWQQAGAATMLDRARERVAQILAVPAEPKIRDDVRRELHGLQETWMGRLADAD